MKGITMKRRISLLLVLCMLFGLMTACGGGEEQTEAAPKYLRTVGTAAASNINPLQANVNADLTVATYTASALYGYILSDEGKGELMPIYADGEPVDVSGDGTVWQIKISKDAKWANGEPMNADTFLYSWKMVLDPNLLMSFAGQFAVNFIEIAGAKDYYMQVANGTTVPWESVGIKKIDDYTVEITAVEMCSAVEVMRHFGDVSSSPVYEPLFEAGMNSDRSATTYGTEKDQILCSGPFYIDTWVKGSEIQYFKNPNWPHADLIKVDGMVSRTVSDSGAAMQLFEAGEVDNIGLGVAALAKYREDPRLMINDATMMYTIDICDTNENLPILANMNFKKALYYGTDREAIAKLAEERPATWLISHRAVSYADGTTFRDLDIANEYLPENFGYDPELALEYFNKAMEEEGLESLTVDMLYASDGGTSSIIAQFLQESLPAIFGADRFTMELSAMPNTEMLSIKKGCVKDPNAYEISVSRWGVVAQRYSPVRALEVYESTYSRRNAPYHCAEGDAAFSAALEPEVRVDEKAFALATAAAEKAYLEGLVTIPVCEQVTYSMDSDRLIRPIEKFDASIGTGFIYSDIKQ